ncbi:hypothetical protein X975_23033, partial [Stegodyphus mimosarum]
MRSRITVSNLLNKDTSRRTYNRFQMTCHSRRTHATSFTVESSTGATVSYRPSL